MAGAVPIFGTERGVSNQGSRDAKRFVAFYAQY